MKTKFIINFAALTMTISSFSQIKIFPGGSVTIGATTSPTANAVTHQIIGGATAFPGTTSAATSAPLIIGQNAVSSSPGFAFLGDHQTGLAHPSSNILAITLANVERFRFSGYQILNKKTSSFSPSTPEYSWDTDPNTGMYRPFADVIAFSTNGTDKFLINSNGQLQSYNAPGTASNPDYGWGVDQNKGMFSAGSNIVGFSTGGTERMRINSSGFLLIGSTSDHSSSAKVQITGVSGGAALTNTVNHSSDWGYCQLNYVNLDNTKAIVVIKSTSENFKVMGSGDAWGKSWTSWSDKNLKENLDSLPNALSKIKQLKGVMYNFKASLYSENIASKKEIGLIAQDVEKVVPEVVNTDDKGIKGIMYQNLIPLLIEAIKEQDKEITQLKNDVSSCCNKSNERLISPDNENTNGDQTGNINRSFIKQNIPNPFNKETTIEYFIIEKNAAASILVFDMNGKLLKTYKLNGSGQGNLVISGNELAPGMYYYSLIVNAKEVGTKKMILTE